VSSGYYKRRRGILEHLESGRISLLELAIHDFLCLKMNCLIGTAATIPPGVCITSATAIHAVCPKQISERSIQRCLEHLEEIGWIKRWNERGKRGNYPILVCRQSVADLSGNEYRVSGEDTTDWHNPVLVSVGELSSLRGVADAKLSGDRELRIEKTSTPAASPRSHRHSPSTHSRAKETTDRAKVKARDERMDREARVRAEAQVGSYRNRPENEGNQGGVAIPPFAIAHYDEALAEVRRTGRDIDEVMAELHKKYEPHLAEVASCR